MKITCPLCGFSAEGAAAIPSDGALGVRDVLSPEVGMITVCAGCGTGLIFTGWVPLVEETMKQLAPMDRAMIRDAQEAIRRARAIEKDSQKKRKGGDA